MTGETIRKLLRKQPSQPFLIRMSNCQFYFVNHPEMRLISKSSVIFGDPETDDFQFLALLRNAATESLAVAA